MGASWSLGRASNIWERRGYSSFALKRSLVVSMFATTVLGRGEHITKIDSAFHNMLTSVAVLDIVSSQKSTSIIISRIESFSHVAISTSHGFHRRNELLPGCLQSLITSDAGENDDSGLYARKSTCGTPSRRCTYS